MKKALLRSKTGTVYDVVLDECKYYFRGDRVLGRLIIIPSKPYRLTGIRLEFFGRIKTYINSKKQDGHYFFKELFPLDVQTSTLQEGKTYTFPFDFHLPVDVALPSCTESDTNAGGIIEYIIMATMERPSREWSALTAMVHIPVLERLDVSKTELKVPVWDKKSWQSQHPEDIIDADEYQGVDQVDLSASIPHKGYTRGQNIPVTVDIQHFQPYQKVNGLTISLIRCTRVLCKEKAYLLSPTIVCSTKANIDIKETTTQTITQSILIPQHISPTINLNARLMQVDYRIEVRAELDDPDRSTGNSGGIASFMTTVTEKRHMDVDLTSMSLQLPVVIGTLPSLSPPPDVLDPKFIKGVKYIGQENKSYQQQLQQQQQQQQQQERQPSRFSSSLSALASLDLSSIPAGLLEKTTTNLRWDQSSSRRQSNITRQQQQQPSISKDETSLSTTCPSPLSTITMNSSTPTAKIPTTPTMSIPTYRSGLAESTTMTTSPTPVYRSDLSETLTPMSTDSPSSPPFYLTVSLGEPFDLLQSGFTNSDQYSFQSSTRNLTTSNSSHISSNIIEKAKPISTTEPLMSVPKHQSLEQLDGLSTSSSCSNAEPNDNTLTSTITTINSGPSLSATINHSNGNLSSDATASFTPPSSSGSSLGANSNGLIITTRPTIDVPSLSPSPSPSPAISSTMERMNTHTPEPISDIKVSPCDTPKDNTDSQSKLTGYGTMQSKDTVGVMEMNTLTTAHNITSITTTPTMNVDSGADNGQGYDLDKQTTNARYDDTKNSNVATTTINHDQRSGSDDDDVHDGGLVSTEKSKNVVLMNNNNNNGLFPVSAAGIYRQLSTYSNYRQTNAELLNTKQNGHEKDGAAYKPESTIEGLEISAATVEPAGPMEPNNNDHHREIQPSTIGNSILLQAQSVDDGDNGASDLFDKPHEMAYSDSDDDTDDDDDDDFLSILARREKQVESNSYWQ